MREETRLATRAYFAANARACADQAEAGTLRVNDPASYIQQQRQRAAEHEAGKWDHTFTFQQHAHWLETGECVALLP